jgi:hypothetical protein
MCHLNVTCFTLISTKLGVSYIAYYFMYHCIAARLYFTLGYKNCI